MSTSPDDDAFDAYAAEITGQYAVAGAALILFFTLAWWPLDAWVMRPGVEREAFGALRIHAGLVELALLIGFATSRWIRRRALIVGPVGYAILLGTFGHALGRVGADGLPWLADAFIGIFPVAFIPVRLSWRIPFTLAIGAALVGGYFIPHPGNLDAPMALGQITFALFAVSFSILVGELSRRVLRRMFLQQRALDAANAELSDLSASLAQRVEEKTRELQALAQHLDSALEAQRRRIARDLHDDLGQSLTAIRYTLARLDGRLPERSDGVDDLIEDLGGLIDGTSASIRGFLTELRPRVLDDYGLVAAAEWHCDRVEAVSGLRCTLTVDPAFPGAPDADGLPGEARLDHDTALALFRVLQEASTNTLKHADAARLDVALTVTGDGFGVQVRDDGRGFDPEAETAGFGLLGLRERIRARGGALEIDATPDGTCVHAILPGRIIHPTPEED